MSVRENARGGHDRLPQPHETTLAPSELPEGAIPLTALQAAYEELRHHRWDEAIAAFQMILKDEPGRFAAVRGLVIAFLNKSKPEEARDVLEQFRLTYPLTAEAWRLAAQLEWKLNQRSQAIRLLRRGLDLLPRSPVLHQQLAVFLAAEGHLNEATTHYQSTTKSAVSDRLGQYLFASAGRVKDVKDLLEAVRVDDPNHIDQDWMDRVVQDPKLIDAILGLPLGSYDHDMLVSIEWRLVKLLSSQPNHPDRQCVLAKVQTQLGNHEAALQSLQRALSTNPDYLEAHRLRAEVLVRIGHTDQAIETLNHLVERGLAWPDVHYRIAELHHEHGRAAEARVQLETAIQLNPAFDQARDLLDRCAA